MKRASLGLGVGLLLFSACAAREEDTREVANDINSRPLPPDGALPQLRKVETVHLGQLTGTALNRSPAFGIDGTDLGISFERDDKLFIFFGDSWTPGNVRANEDSLAWTTSRALPTAGRIPALTWATNAQNQFLAPRLPGVDLGGMNVPMEAIPVGAKTYVFFTTGWFELTKRYSHSVLAEMNGTDLDTLRLVHKVPSKKFINVSAVVEGDTAYLYGSGDYRASPTYLAKVEVARLGDRNAWQYLRSGSGDSAVFGPGEESAAPVTPTACVGELSVRKWKSLYFMTYNCGTPRGILLHWARDIRGPWSEPINIFDPGKDADGGYEHFIHAKESAAGHDDGLSEPNRYEDWGGEYGPYLIPRYFSEEAGGVISLVYTLSSWNPYQAHLMQTRIAPVASTAQPVQRGVGLPKAKLVNADFTQGFTGWTSENGTFGIFNGADGRPRVTTFVAPKGDEIVGKLWQEFTVDATTSELSFSVHGGDARVLLLRGNEVVRSTQGRRRNEPELQVVWNLKQLRGERVRLVIDDSLPGPWGFITVSGFDLR
jgi:hypothetical protein